MSYNALLLGEVRSENSNEIVHAAVCMEGAGYDASFTRSVLFGIHDRHVLKIYFHIDDDFNFGSSMYIAMYKLKGIVVRDACSLDSKDRLTLGILQHVMGTTQRVKYNPYTSLMAKAVTGAAQSPFYVIRSVSNFYSAQFTSYIALTLKRFSFIK